MNNHRYTVEKNGKFVTINSCDDALGVARRLHHLPNPVDIKKVDDYTTVLNGVVTVTKHKL